MAELFEVQAARTPGALAVECGDEALSYAELDERANRLARYLVSLGAGPERLVAVAMDRSAGLVVALLAVLKSGAAYLPVDPQYPAERIGYVLGDARAVLVVCDQATAGRVRAGDIRGRLLMMRPARRRWRGCPLPGWITGSGLLRWCRRTLRM